MPIIGSAGLIDPLRFAVAISNARDTAHLLDRLLKNG
jgi:hypothetical protein